MGFSPCSVTCRLWGPRRWLAPAGLSVLPVTLPLSVLSSLMQPQTLILPAGVTRGAARMVGGGMPPISRGTRSPSGPRLMLQAGHVSKGH